MTSLVQKVMLDTTTAIVKCLGKVHREYQSGGKVVCIAPLSVCLTKNGLKVTFHYVCFDYRADTGYELEVWSGTGATNGKAVCQVKHCGATMDFQAAYSDMSK